MNRCCRWWVLVGAACALSARAEMRLLATAMTDSYRSLSFGVSAFSQTAGFPLTLTDINDQVAQTLLVPALGGVDPQSNMWLFWLMSDQTNRQEHSFSTVAVLPTVDQAATALHAIGGSYPACAWDDERQLWRFTRGGTNGSPNSLAPVVYACVANGSLLVSTTREAVEWVRRHPMAPGTAAPTAIVGQVRIDVQPVTLAALLKAYREQRETHGPDLVNDATERLLSEVRTLSIVIEATTEGLGLQLTLTAIPGSPLEQRLASMHAPKPDLWRLPPVQSSFAVVSGGLSLLDLLESYAPDVRADTPVGHLSMRPACGLTGDSVTFISRTSRTGTIYYASAFATTNSRATWNAACGQPQAFLPFTPSFTLATNGMRTVEEFPVLDLVFTESRTGAATSQNPADMAAFMLRDGGLSLVATTNLLLVTFGPSNAVDHLIRQVCHPFDRSLPLPDRCRKLLPNVAETACAALLLQPVLLVHQVAESLPNMNPNRMASLPEPGDGMAAAIFCSKPGELRLSLRVSADEVSRAQQALKEGRAALREMFMQMAVQQLLQQHKGPGDPRRRANTPAR